MIKNIIELSKKISNYSNKELEEQIISVQRLMDKGFNDIETIIEAVLLSIELIERNKHKD